MAAKRSDIDWQAVEKDYRAGVMTLRQIADAHKTSHQTISTRAKRDGWEQDLSAKIKAKADALLTKAELTKELTSQEAVSERQIVESNAQAIVSVVVGHRSSIRRNKALSEKLLNELEAQCDGLEDFSRLAEIMASSDDKADKLGDLYRKVISLPSRIDGAKKLADTLRVLVSLERESFGLDKEAPTEQPLSGESLATLRRLKAQLGGD